MDISQYNTRVIQEPRGMIRVITLIFAILAFATTSGFDTEIKVNLTCRQGDKGVPVSKVKFPVEYPFSFDGQKIVAPKNCADVNKTAQYQTVDFSSMSFASSAQFYVATGVLSFLYSTSALVLYIFGTRHYETNPLLPVIDLAATAVLTIFWLAGASAWAAGVSDVKYYTSSTYLSNKLDFCLETQDQYCVEASPGKFTSLTISLIFGFANIFLWAASCWFVFKETSFHRKPIPDQLGAGGQQPGFDQFGGQQNITLPAQTHFPQQRQFPDGY